VENDMTMATIHASFFDGRSAHLHPARLSIGAGTLTVTASTFQRSYPLAEVALSEPFAAAPAVLRLQDGASCEVAAGSPRDALLAALGYRESPVVRWQARWPAALLALVLLAALLALAWFRGIPFTAERIAERLPPSVDASLGQATLASLEKQGLLAPSRFSDERLAELQALLPAITPAHGRMPLRLLVRNSPRLGPNALALSDGTIVVTDALVRMVQDKNELTDQGKAQLIAVLGHEVGHIEHRHVVRVMARSSLGAALSATLFGDFSAVAASLPAVLSQMEYSREMELDADAYAVQVLQRRHLSVDHMIDVLNELEAAQGSDAKMPRWMRQSLGYLSTHPETGERLQRLEAISAREAHAQD
jgi:Zn-dependent protease with chaperone function